MTANTQIEYGSIGRFGGKRHACIKTIDSNGRDFISAACGCPGSQQGEMYNASTPFKKGLAPTCKRGMEAWKRWQDQGNVKGPNGGSYNQNSIHAAGRRARQNEMERKHGNPAQDGMDAARQDNADARQNIATAERIESAMQEGCKRGKDAAEAEELEGYIQDTKDDIDIALKIGDTETAERLDKALSQASADSLEPGRAYTSDSGEPMQAAHALHRNLISDEEDEQRDDLLAAFEVALRDLVADACREADKVGGYFRSPGIRVELKTTIEEIARAIK